MPVRLALGFPTIFNLLGPLTNPAAAGRQVMGVYDDRFVVPIAEALRDLDAIRAIVLHSDDGLDELSIAAPTRVVHVREDGLEEQRVDPRALGLPEASLDQLTATDLDHAASLMRAVLDGTEQGPARSMTLLNSAAALIVSDIAPNWEEGIERAADAIDGGEAKARLERLIAISNE
jgi:anthranilate phosphoribosyltransferase